MTPIETFKFLKNKNLDLTAMMILERMAFYDRPIMTGQMVTDATNNSAFTSHATVYKYLARLKERGLIGDVNEYSDGRCKYIEATTKGKKLLKEYVNG
jgi:DNA-binding PadR family transcriptional regulator